MFRYLRLETTEKVAGLGLEVLRMADGLEPQALEIFNLFDSEVQAFREEHRQRERQSRAGRVRT